MDVHTVIKDNFLAFLQMSFRYTHDEALGDQPYIHLLCHKLQQVAKGKTGRLIINIPPRHLKTFGGSICLPAWVLGREPSTNVLIVTYSDTLALDIAYRIRSLMQSPFYRIAFKTRLADDRVKVTDFVTKQGGRVYAVSINGSITGHGADLLIVDDLIDIDDADNLAVLQRVIHRFHSKVMSRLNHPKKGRVVVIQHRLSENDLSAQLKAAGGWDELTLPMIAPCDQAYSLGYDMWTRKKGTLLRPDAFDPEDIERLRKTTVAPDFETLYQQNPGGAGSVRLKSSYFKTYETVPSAAAVVLSIDTAQRSGADNSFSTIQAWSRVGANHFLLSAWREQCDFERLCDRYWSFVRRFNPAVAVIEATAMGPQLITDARRRQRVKVVEIIPDGRSKVERLLAHLPTFKEHRIFVPESAEWKKPYLEEFLQFPNGPNDDQVDATSQYLDFISANPVLRTPPPRAVGVAMTSSGQIVRPDFIPATAAFEAPGCVMLSRRRF